MAKKSSNKGKKTKKSNKSSIKKASKLSKKKPKEISFDTYDVRDNIQEDVEDESVYTKKEDVSHNDIDSEIEDLRRRVLEEEDDAKYAEDDEPKKRTETKSGLSSAMFELIPGLLLSTLGIGHMHNRKIAKGFFILICYWLFVVVELYVLFNIFTAIDTADLYALTILLVIVNLLIIFMSTHSAYHEVRNYKYH